MKLIELTQNKQALIDDEDFEQINSYKWRFDGRYAVSGKHPNHLLMHRLINNTPKDYLTDHVNGNKLDNCRKNLRSCTSLENSRNVIFRGNKNGFKGVYKLVQKNKIAWIAKLKILGKNKYLGTFTNPIQAAKAYDEGAKKYFGEFAKINFI